MSERLPESQLIHRLLSYPMARSRHSLCEGRTPRAAPTQTFLQSCDREIVPVSQVWESGQGRGPRALPFLVYWLPPSIKRLD
jgi:hypothetical protein